MRTDRTTKLEVNGARELQGEAVRARRVRRLPLPELGEGAGGEVGFRPR